MPSNLPPPSPPPVLRGDPINIRKERRQFWIFLSAFVLAMCSLIAVCVYGSQRIERIRHDQFESPAVYRSWQKLHQDTPLTCEEWKVARWNGLLNQK